MKAQMDIGWSTARKNIWILPRKMNDTAKLLAFVTGMKQFWFSHFFSLSGKKKATKQNSNCYSHCHELHQAELANVFLSIKPQMPTMFFSQGGMKSAGFGESSWKRLSDLFFLSLIISQARRKKYCLSPESRWFWTLTLIFITSQQKQMQFSSTKYEAPYLKMNRRNFYCRWRTKEERDRFV